MYELKKMSHMYDSSPLVKDKTYLLHIYCNCLKDIWPIYVLLKSYHHFIFMLSKITTQGDAY